MRIIKNQSDLQQAYQDGTLDRLFITGDAEQKIKGVLEENVQMLTSAYGNEGAGGYICIIPHSLSTSEGKKAYLEELGKYNLEPDMWEMDDVIASSDIEEVHLQLFVMTEYHLILLYLIERK